MKKVVFTVALVMSATLTAMDKQKVSAYLYDRGLKSFYVDAQRFSNKFAVKDLKDGGFLLKAEKTPKSYSWWNYVAGGLITEETIKEAQEYFKYEDGSVIPYCIFVDQKDERGEKLVQDHKYEFAGTFLELITRVDSFDVEKYEKGLTTVVAEGVSVEPVINEEDLLHWIELVASAPGFEIDPKELRPIYQSFHTLVRKPGLLMSVWRPTEYPEEKEPTGAISAHLMDGILPIYSLSTGKEFRQHTAQKLVVGALAKAREISKDAWAVYVGFPEEFEQVFKPLGFEEQRKIHIYAKK